MITQLLLLAGLILLSGFFSGTETAFTSLSALQIHRLEESGGKRGGVSAPYWLGAHPRTRPCTEGSSHRR